MQSRKYEALDGAPVTTTDCTLMVMPMGVAEVHHGSDGFAIAVGNSEPIVVPPGEFERLVAEGQLHGLPVDPNGDEEAL